MSLVVALSLQAAMSMPLIRLLGRSWGGDSVPPSPTPGILEAWVQCPMVDLSRGGCERFGDSREGQGHPSENCPCELIARERSHAIDSGEPATRR